MLGGVSYFCPPIVESAESIDLIRPKSSPALGLGDTSQSHRRLNMLFSVFPLLKFRGKRLPSAGWTV